VSLHELVDLFRSLWGLWLMIFFLGIVFYAFQPKNRDRLESYGDIPLRDDDKER